jgi:hypothetical protein
MPRSWWWLASAGFWVLWWGALGIVVDWGLVVTIPLLGVGVWMAFVTGYLFRPRHRGQTDPEVSEQVQHQSLGARNAVAAVAVFVLSCGGWSWWLGTDPSVTITFVVAGAAMTFAWGFDQRRTEVELGRLSRIKVLRTLLEEAEDS